MAALGQNELEGIGATLTEVYVNIITLIRGMCERKHYNLVNAHLASPIPPIVNASQQYRMPCFHLLLMHHNSIVCPVYSY